MKFRVRKGYAFFQGAKQLTVGSIVELKDQNEGNQKWKLEPVEEDKVEDKGEDKSKGKAEKKEKGKK